jgi:hypothetical protein
VYKLLEIKTKVKKELWNEFLQKCGEATLYHTPEWKSILEDAFGFYPKYLFLVDENERVLGELPLFYVKSRLFGSHVSSLPFSHYCGYIGEKSHQNDILEKAIQMLNDTKSNYLEIRSYIDDSRFRQVGGFYTHVLELSNSPEDVWKRLDKGSVRWAIKKSKEMGLTVHVSRDLGDLKEFYELNCINKKNLGVPCHPWKFFKLLFDRLAESALLYIAKYKGNTIAGGVMLCYKHTVLYGYGAADPKSLRLHPYHAFIWASIEDACSKGFLAFDFGRSSDAEIGLKNFKKRWGTNEINLYYSYYPQRASTPLVDFRKKKFYYDFARFAIRHSPMWIYKKFSDRVVGGLG